MRPGTASRHPAAGQSVTGTRHIMDCQHELCLPPLDIPPPPPPPPWLDLPPLCNCDSVPEVSSINNAQEIFKNVLLVLVLSVSVIITLLTLSLLLRRRWRARQKNPSQEKIAPITQDKQLSPPLGINLPRTPQNYYSRDHRVVVDQMGQTIIIACGKSNFIGSSELHSSQVSSDIQSSCGIDIYETIDSDIYSEHYSTIRDNTSPASLYENPDAAIYNRPSPLTQDISIMTQTSADRLSRQTRH